MPLTFVSLDRLIDLTIKVENNTTTGLGIYSESVTDKTQSVDDASIEYAQLGSLILLKILPYREEVWRYLVYNTITQNVERIDAIGQSCVQLPEDRSQIVFRQFPVILSKFPVGTEIGKHKLGSISSKLTN